MLHIINKSASQSSAFEQCLQFSQVKDVIILIEDAVLTAHKNASQNLLAANNKGVAIYALEEDLAARGLKGGDCETFIKVVKYQGFVELVCQHKPVKSWF